MAQDYSKILKNPEIIQWAKESLKKRNRIEWYLKQVREYPHIHPSEELKHFYAMNIPSINDYLVKSEPINILLQIFKKLEIEYFNSLKKDGFLIADDLEPHKKILDLPEMLSEWKWINLNQRSSDIEAQAMGHCGNSVGKPKDKILSLRKLIIRGGQKIWEPHLTFILQKDGYLGEMKGKQNNKPQEKYHPQILALLKLKEIKGIRGGGYFPERNFMLSDLNDFELKSFIVNYPEKVSNKLPQVLENLTNLEFLKSLNYESEADDAKFFLSFIKDQSVLIELAKSSCWLANESFMRINDFETICQILNSTYMYDGSLIKDAQIFKQMSEEQAIRLFKLGMEINDEFLRLIAMKRLGNNSFRMQEIFLLEINSRMSSELVRKFSARIDSKWLMENFQGLSFSAKRMVLMGNSGKYGFIPEIVLKERDNVVQSMGVSLINQAADVSQVLDSNLSRELKKETLMSFTKHYLRNTLYFRSLAQIMEVVMNPCFVEEVPQHLKFHFYDKFYEELYKISKTKFADEEFNINTSGVEGYLKTIKVLLKEASYEFKKRYWMEKCPVIAQWFFKT